METSIANRAFLAAALALLLGGTLASVLVAERGLDALWQWYKFAGYSGPGYITLHVGPGLALICGCTAMAVAALLLARAASNRGLLQARKLALVAALASFAPLLVYVALLAGPLAIWQA